MTKIAQLLYCDFDCPIWIASRCETWKRAFFINRSLKLMIVNMTVTKVLSNLLSYWIPHIKRLLYPVMILFRLNGCEAHIHVFKWPWRDRISCTFEITIQRCYLIQWFSFFHRRTYIWFSDHGITEFYVVLKFPYNEVAAQSDDFFFHVREVHMYAFHWPHYLISCSFVFST